MGAKKARLERFKREHPICYFCATRPTQTEDHMPGRQFFIGRVGPEDFAFPCCEPCNAATRQIEQAVALIMRFGDHTERRIPPEELERLALGVRNNVPHLLPTIDTSARAVRKYMKEAGISPPRGASYKETPILNLPDDYHDAFELFARKLTCALHYKETGQPIPLDSYIGVTWRHIGVGGTEEMYETLRKTLGLERLGRRRNTDIGDQFGYRFNYNIEHGLFAMAAVFGKSFLVFGAVNRRLSNVPFGWKVHRDDVPAG